MDNKQIKELENLPRVKELQKEIYQIQREYLEQQKQIEREKKEQYKIWYSQLSEAEKIEEDIKVQKEKIKSLNEKQKKLKQEKKVKTARDERTHLLCVLGGIIQKVAKDNNIIIKLEDTDKVLSALLYNYKSSGDNIFISNFLREKEKDNPSENHVINLGDYLDDYSN